MVCVNGPVKVMWQHCKCKNKAPRIYWYVTFSLCQWVICISLCFWNELCAGTMSTVSFQCAWMYWSRAGKLITDCRFCFLCVWMEILKTCHPESYWIIFFLRLCIEHIKIKNNKETSMQICGNCYRTTVGVCVTLLCLDGRNKANHMLLVAVSVERCIDDKLKIWVTHYK